MQHCLKGNLEHTGDLSGALQALIEQLKTEEDPYHTYNDIVELSAKLKDHDSTIKYGLLLIEIGAVDTEILVHIANAYDAKNDYLHSAKFLEKAARNGNDETSWLWNNAGRALALAGQTDEAMFYFRMVLKLKPDSEMAHYYLGLAYQKKEDVYMALHHYTEALKIKPDFAEVYNNLAAISYHENGSINEAIQNLEKALEANPEPKFLTTLYMNLARVYKSIADYDRHEYYKAKMMQSIGFDTEFDEEDEDDEDFDEEDDAV